VDHTFITECSEVIFECIKVLEFHHKQKGEIAINWSEEDYEAAKVQNNMKLQIRKRKGRVSEEVDDDCVIVAVKEDYESQKKKKRRIRTDFGKPRRQSGSGESSLHSTSSSSSSTSSSSSSQPEFVIGKGTPGGKLPFLHKRHIVPPPKLAALQKKCRGMKTTTFDGGYIVSNSCGIDVVFSYSFFSSHRSMLQMKLNLCLLMSGRE
jgi:hypothetical protein